MTVSEAPGVGPVRALGACVLSLGLAACATVPRADTPEQLKIGGIDLASKSAEMQMVVFQTPDDTEKFCMTPAPDAVPTVDRQLTLGRGTESVGGGYGVSAGLLGGRSESVLITRELLYRACEFSLNYRLDRDAALALYQQTLDRIERLAPALQAAGTQAVTAPMTTLPTARAQSVPNDPNATTKQSTVTVDED